jgi:murein DD-endopeptidase MepM/ murein hydrolase activator NlpD
MRRAALLLIVAIVVGLVSGPAGAADPSAELDAVRDELDSLASQIDNSRAESRAVGERLAGAQTALSAVQAELSEAQGRVDALTAEIEGEEAHLANVTAQLDVIQKNLVETTVELQNTLDDLEIQVVELYMNATASVTTMILGFNSAAEASVGLVYVEEVTGQSEDLLDTFAFLKLEEERQQGLALERQAEVEEIIGDLEGERVVLEGEVAVVEGLRLEAEANLEETRSLLAQINSDIEAAESRHASLEADAERLEAEIIALQDQGGTNPGVLGWPVNGRVTSPYGYRIHPIFGTKKLHTGIDIAAGSGTPIAAAGSGRVILAETYGGYGRAVVIDHGGGLATLYAHQSSIAVSVGQRVNRGDTIGYVGCSGSCTGPHLHFETRESGARVDPMKYLNG